MEFAVGVPGTVGGAVFMNAGADGQDTASALSSVECISPDGSERVVVDAADVRFGYRKSPPCATTTTTTTTRRTIPRDRIRTTPRRGIRTRDRTITRTRRTIPRDRIRTRAGSEPPTAIFARAWLPRARARGRRRRQVARASFCARRRETQPLAARSVGCVFRARGREFSPARALIDAAGLKGTRCGDAEVSPAHANFLVYRRRERDDEDDEDDVGPASGGASEFEALIRRVKRAVFDATGVELREEVRRVPLTFEPAPTAKEADSDSREARRRKPR